MAVARADSTGVTLDSVKIVQMKKMTQKIKKLQIPVFTQDPMFYEKLLMFVVMSKMPQTQNEVDSCMQRVSKELEATKKAMSE